MTKANKKLTDNGNKLSTQPSLQLLPLIMQNIPQAVFWKDQNLVYLGCNQAFAEDAGFASPEEVIGKTDFDMPWKGQAELYRADDQRVLDSGESKLDYEEPQTAPGGSTTWLRTSKIPVCEDGRVVAILGMYEDITDRKKAEVQLQQEKSFSDAIINGLPGSFYLFDLEGKMIRWNKKYEEISGYNAEEIPTMSVIDTLSEDDREAALTTIQRALMEGQGAVEAKFITKDGRSIPYYFAGQRLQIDDQVYMAGTGMDLTERKKTETALRESEQKFRNLADNFAVGLFIHQKGIIRYMGHEAARLLGYEVSEMVGRPIMDFVHPEERQRIAEIARQRPAGAEVPDQYETRLLKKNGSALNVLMYSTLVEYEGQVATQGAFLDITERKQLEVQVQEAFDRRGLQVQLSTQVSQSIAAASSLEELYERVVTQVKEQFGYYHTQLLRYDEAQDAVVLVTGYGETGAKMLAAGHRMPMGEGLIGTAAATGETILRPALESDPDWHPNPLLPETKGEIAVPVKLGDAILGVLDVQSSTAGALGADDQLLLEGLCGQIATAIESTRLRQEMAEQAEKDILLRDRALASSLSAVLVVGLDFKPIYVNESFLKMTGYTYEEAMQLTITDISGDPEGLEQISEATNRQGFFIGEEPIKRKDGSIFLTDFSTSYITDDKGKPIAIQTTFVDITERKKAEAQLQQEKSFSDTIINGLPGTFYLFDTQGKLIRWNKQYEQVLGYTAEETATRNAIEPIAEEDRERTATAIQRTFVEGQGSVEANFVTKDGRHIPYYFVGQRIQLGDQLYLAGTGIDISERKKLEEQIQTALEHRGLQVQLSTQVSQSIAAASSLEELYERVVTQVKEQFGYYHTQLLRHDEAQDAVVLVTGYGETGAKMLAAGHRMPMGEGLIGTAAATGETILRPALESDPDWHPNPLLPETKGEIAVPIKLGDAILGVLDVQSSTAGALSTDDQLLLEGLCGQIATAIEGTRLRQEIAKKAEEDLLFRDRALASSVNAVMINSLDGKTIYVNDAFLKMFGYTHEEALQLTAADTAGTQEDIDEVLAAYQAEGFFAGESRCKRKDGSIFPVSMSSSSIVNAEGTPLAMQATFLDITERKQAEIQLQQEKSFSDTIINGLPGTFYLFDLQGKMLRWNKQYEQVSGYSAEEIPTMGVADSIAEEDRERVATTIQRAFMEGQATVEASIINKDGKRTPYYLTGQRLQIGDQTYLVGTGVDITERKQAERALRESQQFLQTIMDNIPQSIFWKDNNLTYLGCNSAFAADTGLASPNDVIGKTDWDMPWKEQAEVYRADDSLVMKNGVPKLNYEEPQTTPDGQTSWLRTSKIPLYDIDGNPFAVLGMYEDITERKQAEETVRTSREQLLNIIDFLPDATLVTDKDRKVIAWNRAIEEMTGIKNEEIIGKGDYAYAVPFYGDARPMLVDFAMEHTQIADRYEGIQQQGDRLSAEIYVSSVYQGRGGHLLAIASPLYDANGNIVGAIESIRDVTERKQLEIQIQEAFERRGLQVQLSTQISQSIAAAASLEELYERVVTQVKEQFGYYHTQILRYDEAQDAVVLVTGYGETGAKMLAAGHRMPLGEGLIGTAAATGETLLRAALENDPDWHPNPLLPETKGEIAVPIKLGNDILGVLDIQSSVTGALGADDQLLLEGLCGQIATAIEDTRLRQEMAERLEEVNRLYRAMSHEGWETYRQATDIPSSFMYDQAGLREAKDVDLTDELFANVPLAIPGGEVIGTLAVADDPQRPITPEDEAFLQQVSEQLALALESARLFEQTQSALASVQESQAALDQAMDVAGMANWNLSFETFRFTFNERLYQMLGTTVEEEGGYELSAEEYTRKYIHPEDGALIAGAIQTGLQDPDPKNFKGSLEYRMLRKDGQIRYMLTDYRLVVNEQGKAVGGVGSFLDITERKLVELAVQESQTALNEAMDIANMANWKLNFETLNFTFNDRLYKMLGVRPEESNPNISAQEYASKYLHPDDVELLSGAIQEALQAGLQSPDPQNFKGRVEYRLIRKDGQTRYMLSDYRLDINEQGKAVGVVGSFLDVTERKLAELAVSKRAAELATVAEVGTATAATLEPDRLLQSVVDLAKERFGLYHAHIYTYDESWNTLLMAAGAGEVGRKLVAEEHAIPMSLEQSLVARAARERKAVIINDVTSEPGFLPNPLLPDTRAEMAVPMTAGDKLLGVFDVQSSSTNGFSEEDANIYVTLASQVAVALQNARMYVEQAALVTQLRELDRLKSSFLANMSHELRTPLNSILGFADVIIEELDGPLTENMSNDLRLIQKNGQHLLHLINDVLDMAKIEAGRMNLNPENFKAFEVLEEVTSITSTLASEKNLALFIDEEADQEVGIYADRTRLRQVMINLVNNAIKFTENGKIALKVVPLEGARILITVKDTGIGIPPDKLEAVFQEFTQVDSSTTRKVGGTGLGLPISRRLVEMHGGRLWAESTGINGEGSTFFVELPVEARITETIEKQAK